MATDAEPSLLARWLYIGLVATSLILLGYAVRDYASGGGSVRTLLLPVGSVTLAIAMLISPRRPRLSWALLAITLVANAVWFLRTAT